jgi:predicted NUDIX family phosphoesterase
MGTEHILVVPRAELFAAQRLQGFSADPALVAHYLHLISIHGRCVPRRPAEEDEELKQIVPYGVVLHGEQVFLFQRGQKGTEAGLRGRWSIGLGGHVNPGDGAAIGPAMLERALRRELAEEVHLDAPRPELWGVLNHDANPVGRRHCGFVYRVWVVSPGACSREPGKIAGAFVALQEAWGRREEMESWSQMVLAALAGGGTGR